jgi:anti-anti-sigma factor
VSTSVHNDTVVVAARGDVDAARVPRVLAALVAALTDSPSKRVVLDLSRVTFLGSHGLGMLVDISGRAAARGRVVSSRGRGPTHVDRGVRVVVGEPARAVGDQNRELAVIGLFHRHRESVSGQGALQALAQGRAQGRACPGDDHSQGVRIRGRHVAPQQVGELVVTDRPALTEQERGQRPPGQSAAQVDHNLVELNLQRTEYPAEHREVGR